MNRVVACGSQNPPRSKVTKRCQPGTSRTTNDGKFPLADGFSRVAQRFANILDLKVRISIKDFGFRHAFAYHAHNIATGMRRARMHGRPPIWLGSTVMRVNIFTSTSVRMAAQIALSIR